MHVPHITVGHIKKQGMAAIILIVFILVTGMGQSVQASWKDTLHEGWNKTKDSASSLCFWCEKTLSEVKEDFQDAIAAYDSQHLAVGQSFAQGKQALFTFESLLRDAKDKDDAFAEVHNQWLQVEKAINRLKDRFDTLSTSAQGLFGVLDRKAESITDAALKQQATEKIALNRAQYEQKLAATKESIATLDSARTKVFDMITSLEISYTLDSLEGQIDKTLEEIDTSITAVMADLASLSVESKALLAM